MIGWRGNVLGGILALLVLSLFAVYGTRSASAAGATGITIVQNDVKSSFPTQIDFHIVAQSSGQLTSARVSYQVGDDPITFVGRADVQPSARIDAHYIVDLQRDYLPPGVTIHWQWTLQDQTGAQGVTAVSDFVLLDPRFHWHQKTSGSIQLNWHDVDDSYATSVLNAATKAYSTSGQPPTGSDPKIQIYIYGRDQDFRSALGVGTNSWVGGQTFPRYHVVLLLVSPTDVTSAQRSIAHEMTHVRTDANDAGAVARLPSWLDEGTSMVAEGNTDPAFAQALAQAVRDHRLLSLQSLTGNFPESSDGATVAYAESESIVRYFISKYGSDKLAALTEALRSGMSSDEAFQQTIGVSAHDFQTAWEASLGSAAAPTATPVGSPIARAIAAPFRAVSAFFDALIHAIQPTKPVATRS